MITTTDTTDTTTNNFAIPAKAGIHVLLRADDVQRRGPRPTVTPVQTGAG